MHNLMVGMHIANKTEEILPLLVDFEKSIGELKQDIAERLNMEANKLEIVYLGNALKDDVKLSDKVRPNGMVHCFTKTNQSMPISKESNVQPEASLKSVQDLFNMIAHIQISVSSRVTILQKIITEYPEFRRNLGAQAFIRDSVLFNTLHQPEVIKNIMETYPIIYEAAPFIVTTIRKELARTASSSFSEPTTDSPTSSEEENSLNASNYRNSNGTESGNQSESARIRTISRRQLQAALDQIGFGSHNSLSNIAQRNTDAVNGTSAPLSNSTSGERISSDMFRHELQRALNSLSDRPITATTDPTHRMDTSETPVQSASNSNLQEMADTTGDIPSYLQTHAYAEQLSTMAQMGFTNHTENLTYLEITNGNIENAVNLLMGANN